MNEYKCFKVGDKVKHRFRDKKYLNCEIVEINENQLPLIKVSENGEISLLPWMDLVLIK
jgi:hypothetical protein